MASRKIQLPAIGGLRKVIKTGDDRSANPGTTIAEFANQIITISQLKAALGLTNAPSSPGGGGGGINAALVPGPGLGGGGPLVGAVPITLIAPIPAFIFDDGGGGGDADPGPPGQQGIDGANGATGQQGPIGPAVQMIPDDGEDGWHAIPGNPGLPGSAGPPGSNGPAVFLAADDGEDGWHAIPGNPGPAGSNGANGMPGPAVGIMDTGEGTDEMPFVAPPSPLRIGNKGAYWGSDSALVAADCLLFFVNCPLDGTIVRVRVVTTGGPGSCVLDIWKAQFGSFPPTVANTITAAAKPTISSGTTYTDSTLSGWTRRINAGDVLAFKVDSTSTFNFIQIVIEVQQ